MENCVFCKIVKGEIPSHKVYENDNFLAFLDIRPESAGHTLIIPKEHYRWAWDMTEQEAGEFFKVAHKIANAQRKAFGVEMVVSKIVGEEVPHAHIWLVPDRENTKEDKNDFEGNAKKIKESL